MVEEPASGNELVENSSGHSWYIPLRSRISPGLPLSPHEFIPVLVVSCQLGSEAPQLSLFKPVPSEGKKFSRIKCSGLMFTTISWSGLTTLSLHLSLNGRREAGKLPRACH